MSRIEWTTKTWNPTVGCSKVSEGCKNCYAINQAHRNAAMGAKLENPGRLAYYEGLTEKRAGRIEWTGKVNFVPEALEIPMKTRKPTTWFVNSMSDLFHESVTDEQLDQIFAVMALTPQHTYQVLTKRPERMLEYCSNPETPCRVDFFKEVIKAGRIDAYNASHEESKPVVGWDGYFVTSHGRVFSDRTNAGNRNPNTLHEVKPQYGTQGHARVMLQGNGQKCRRLIHRMVLEHFDRAPKDGDQGCHIDGDATNNALWNLKWGTQKDNWNDSKRHGNRRRYFKLSEKEVELIREKLKCCHTYTMLAKEFNVSETQIGNIDKGLQWTPEYSPIWPIENCWLGVTAENQRTADERIPLLLETPAALRFLSCEPLLEKVYLRKPVNKAAEGIKILPSTGIAVPDFLPLAFTDINWVIVGGESAPKARPCDIAWIRSIVEQCKDAEVPCFVKQLGSKPFYSAAPADISFPSTGKGNNPDEWPEDLRVREFPEVAT